MIVPGNFPIGCVAVYLTVFQSDRREDYESGTGCIEWLNQFSMYHNRHLLDELSQLRRRYPEATIIYANYYEAAMAIFRSPQEYGALLLSSSPPPPLPPNSSFPSIFAMRLRNIKSSRPKGRWRLVTCGLRWETALFFSHQKDQQG